MKTEQREKEENKMQRDEFELQLYYTKTARAPCNIRQKKKKKTTTKQYVSI